MKGRRSPIVETDVASTRLPGFSKAEKIAIDVPLERGFRPKPRPKRDDFTALEENAFRRQSVLDSTEIHENACESTNLIFPLGTDLRDG